MYTYDIDGLYATIADELFTAKERAQATGGKNNIRAKGDGPEKAVRDWIASTVGTQYRVTEGHVVRADGRKSRQLDIIVVRDVPTATMYGSKADEPELVRAECVAAVGEVKASWHTHENVLQDYGQTVAEMEGLQDGLLVENRARFGEIRDDAPLSQLAQPVTGREWLNRCYIFVIALAQGKCRLATLADDMANEQIAPRDAAALILDQHKSGAICIPFRARKGRNVVGMQCEVYRTADEKESVNRWTTLQETVEDPRTGNGRMLHLFLTDLQLHLSTWCWEFMDPRPYAKLSPALKRRHPNEQRSA